MRRLDRDEYLVVVEAAELVRQRLQHGRVIADLVEGQGADDGRPWGRRGGRAARPGAAGVEQRREGHATGDAKAGAEAAVKERATGVAARRHCMRVGHVESEAISGW